MAKNIVINGVTYNDTPSFRAYTTGGELAEFVDTSDATATSGAEMLQGKTAYANGTKLTGQIVSKSAQTYMPSTSDQTIQSGQYLSGAQTIKGDANLKPQYIASGITIFEVTGTLSSPVISQDPVTKVITIS